MIPAYTSSSLRLELQILLHNPAEVPRVGQQYFRAALNQEVVVSIKPEMMTTSEGLKGYDPHKRNCYFPSERDLSFFKVYTQRNCEVECIANYTLSMCGCVAFYMPREYLHVIVSPVQNTRKRRLCHKHLFLTQIDFDGKTSSLVPDGG